MSTFKEAFTEDSFYLKFQPILDPQGAWTGDIDISAIIHDDHSLSYEELGEMLHVLQMVCASVPLYEQDDEVREKAMPLKYMYKMFPITKPGLTYAAILSENVAKEYKITVPKSGYR